MGACLKAREIEWEVCWLKLVSPWLLFCLYPDGLAHRKSSHLLLCVHILFIILHYPKRDQMQPHPRNGCFKMMLFSGSAVSSSFAALARLQNKWRALRPHWGDEYGCSRLVKSALSVLMWSLKTESSNTEGRVGAEYRKLEETEMEGKCLRSEGLWLVCFFGF